MGVGQISLSVSALTCLLALGLYAASLRSPAAAKAARALWYLHCLGTLIAVAALWFVIMTKDYSYSYVYGYTSNDLNFWYRLSAFWAGQEGSFLLWAALGCAIGLFLIWRARDYERETMVWVAVVQLCLFVLMLLKSPFAPFDGDVPADGGGLNPLLQNPWMVIHPPLVFLGYAAMVLPFAFAMAALMRREYDGWVKRALPWCGFAWLSLGAGIIVGGYWAYETLGWGGYWGWDPVENASLVPWLIGTALLHGLITQERTKSLRSMNFFLAAFSFVTVVYGTYLTRSGVLGDFSVHSFADMGSGYNACLLAFIAIPLVAWIALFTVRKGEIRGEKAYENPGSLAFVLHLGIITLLVSAALVGIGMSSPIITGLTTKNPSAVQLSFYNVTHTPIALALALLTIFAPLMPWRGAKWADLWRSLRWPFVLGVLGALGTIGGTLAFAATAKDEAPALLAKSIPWYLLVGFATTALFVNLSAVVTRLAAGRRLQTGAPLAHTGLAFMLLSFVGSSAYDRERKVTVALGESVSAFGYELTHRGTEERPDGKLQVNVDIARGNHLYKGKALMFQAKQGLMRTPAIKRGVLHDLYVEPESLDAGRADHASDTVSIAKGKSVQVGPYEVTFEDYDMSQHGQDGSMAVGAKLKISVDGGEPEEVTPLYTIQGETLSHPPAEFDGGAATVSLMGMTVESGEVHLHLHGDKVPGHGGDEGTGEEKLIIQVSHKPMMTSLWLGCILLMLGSSVAIRRRALEARSEIARREKKGKKRGE